MAGALAMGTGSSRRLLALPSSLPAPTSALTSALGVEGSVGHTMIIRPNGPLARQTALLIGAIGSINPVELPSGLHEAFRVPPPSGATHRILEALRHFSRQKLQIAGHYLVVPFGVVDSSHSHYCLAEGGVESLYIASPIEIFPHRLRRAPGHDWINPIGFQPVQKDVPTIFISTFVLCTKISDCWSNRMLTPGKVSGPQQ